MTDERANYTVGSMRRDIQEKLRPDAAPPKEVEPTGGEVRMVKDEKATRIKYQDMVYSICNLTDEARGDGGAERCTIDNVVDRLRELLLARTPEVEQLLTLRENWDSYGAPKISHEAVEGAKLLWSLLATEPSFVPMSDGGVQMEWHNRGFDVELEISPDGKLADDAPEVVEPVAWRYRHKSGGPGSLLTSSPAFFEPESFEIQPLYASPPEPEFTICPKCAGELIVRMECDGRCGKMWTLDQLRKLLGDE